MGPREAIFHAHVRKELRLHSLRRQSRSRRRRKLLRHLRCAASFDTFTGDELGITPLKYDNSFYCRRCSAMATAKSCPHDCSYHVALSGSNTEIQTRLTWTLGCG